MYKHLVVIKTPNGLINTYIMADAVWQARSLAEAQYGKDQVYICRMA